MLTQNAWPAPTPPTVNRPPMHRGVRNVIVGIALFLFVAAGVRVITQDASTGNSQPKTTGSFYASPGWTINRAADLSVKIQYDDGVSGSRADCAMKAIVGVTTWLEWQSMGSAGQLSVIRAAERAC